MPLERQLGRLDSRWFTGTGYDPTLQVTRGIWGASEPSTQSSELPWVSSPLPGPIVLSAFMVLLPVPSVPASATQPDWRWAALREELEEQVRKYLTYPVGPGWLVQRKMLKCTLGAEDVRARVATDSRNFGPALPFPTLL